MTLTTSLGQRITFFREKSNLTQKELAEKLKIAKSTMSQYESDERRPNDEIKIMMCNIFNITLDELLGRNSQHTAKDQRDLNEFLNNTEIMFDGELHQLDDEDREKLRHALEFVFWQAKEKNKRKPTK